LVGAARADARGELRFEVFGEVLVTFRDALAKIRRDAGEPLDDDAALLLMARALLEGPCDDGRSPYQIALTVCESWQRGAMQANGELVDVGPEVVEMASCDAQHLGCIDGVGAHRGAPAEVPRAAQSIPPAMRRLVLRRDHGRCVVPGCRHAIYVDVHHLETRADGGPNAPDNLVTLCGAHHRALHRGSLIIEGKVGTRRN
jgi:hypothetical protein